MNRKTMSENGLCFLAHWILRSATGDVGRISEMYTVCICGSMYNWGFRFFCNKFLSNCFWLFVPRHRVGQSCRDLFKQLTPTRGAEKQEIQIIWGCCKGQQTTKDSYIRLLLCPCKTVKSLAASLPICNYSKKCKLHCLWCFLMFNNIILSDFSSAHPWWATSEHTPSKHQSQ